MPPRPQIVDSLWHCLCPAYRVPVSRHRWQPRATSVQSHNHILGLIRFQSTSSEIAQPSSAPPTDERLGQARTSSGPQSLPLEGETSRPTSGTTDYAHVQSKESKVPHRNEPHKIAQSRLARSLSATLPVASAEDLVENQIRKIREKAWIGDLTAARSELEHLATLGKPSSFVGLYALMIEANCSTEHGSLDEVQCLLQEMETRGIKPNQAIFEALLKVLAIHPSHILRQSVVDAMKQQWIEISPESRQHIVCGLLRERQIELALHEIQDMHDQGIEVPAWLKDVTIHVLNSIDEFDSLYSLLVTRYEDRDTPPSQILNMSVMSRAARSLHHPLVKLIWDSQVAFNLLNPSTGLCTAVLDTAARAGDPTLATDVFRILGNRSSPLSTHHYEALIEAHMAARQPDLYKVFSIISIMNRSGSIAQPEEIGVSIHQYLRKHTDLLEEAWSLLYSLKENRMNVPILLPNAILEAAVQQGQIQWALDSYKQLHEICDPTKGNGANTNTFNILLRGCYKAQRKDLAMFVAAEMVALNVAPDALTYDRLILACLHGDVAGQDESASPDEIPDVDPEQTQSPYEKLMKKEKNNLKDAFRYLGEMQSRGWWPRNGTLNALGEKAVDCNDDRAHSLIKWMERLGSDAYLIKERLRQKQDARIY